MGNALASDIFKLFSDGIYRNFATFMEIRNS